MPPPPRRVASNDSVNANKEKEDPLPTKTPRPRAASVDAVIAPPTGDGSETVKVVVRMRPFNTKEKNEGRGPCVELDYKLRQVM
jgi:hypothetical protein